MINYEFSVPIMVNKYKSCFPSIIYTSNLKKYILSKTKQIILKTKLFFILCQSTSTCNITEIWSIIGINYHKLNLKQVCKKSNTELRYFTTPGLVLFKILSHKMTISMFC